MKLQKHTLHLFEGDYEKLAALHPDLAPAVVIRTLVHNHIRRVEEKVPTPNLELQE